MRKQIFSGLRLAFLILLLPAILLAAELTMPAFYSDTYYAELPKMVQYLKQSEGKRLILIGGSSVAFGIDTQLLEELLRQYGYEYTVCPMGLYAAVGTDVMLDLTEPQLREGDLVILAMEPTSETMSAYFGASSYWKCAESAPGILLLSDSGKQAALVGSYIGYLQERQKIRESGEYPAAEGVYALSSFNAQCNMIYDRTGNTMLLGYDLSEPIDLRNVTVSDAFAEHVRQFRLDAEKKGARLLLSFAPMNRSAMVDDSEETLSSYFRLCTQTFGCTPISDPGNYILDSGWFYDSNFHLNTAGARVRTYQLAADLLTELGCYQALSFEPVAMPESAAVLPEESAESDGFLFEAAAGGNGYLVAGLTEQGLLSEELTVPSLYAGLPVVGFAEGALKDAVNLVQLRLPASIQSIPDRLFVSCGSLRRLILEHTEAPCTITEHSLDGAGQLRVYVPREAYSLYRDGTGCRENLWAAYLDRIYTF